MSLHILFVNGKSSTFEFSLNNNLIEVLGNGQRYTTLNSNDGFVNGRGQVNIIQVFSDKGRCIYRGDGRLMPQPLISRLMNVFIKMPVVKK